MGYKVIFNDPTGTSGTKSVTLPGDSYDERPGNLTIMDGDKKVASFVNWYAVYPDDVEEAHANGA